MGEFANTCIMVTAMVVVTAMMIVMLIFGFNTISEVNKAGSQEVIGQIQCEVINTEISETTSTFPVMTGKTVIYIPRTEYRHLVTVKDENGTSYEIDSTNLYNYCDDNNTVTLDVREFKDNPYLSYDGKVLKYRVISD